MAGLTTLQQSVRTWARWHFWTPAALAVVVSGFSLVVAIRLSAGQGKADPWALGLAIIAALVAVMALVLIISSWRRTAKYVLSLGDEATGAGIWIMKTAFGKRPDDDPVLQEFPWVRGGAAPIHQSSRLVKEWLDQYRTEIQNQAKAVSDEMQRDMDLAKEFQLALINRPYPEVPAVHVEGRLRLEFHHRYQPTMAVGGDFFDIIPISNDCAGIFVADVMGHGVRSALITAILRALISEMQPQARHASHFLREVNNEFAEILAALPNPLFASGFYMVVDTTSRIGTYACAGHPPPIQITRDRNRVSRLTVPHPRGAALGLLPQEHYPGETVRLLDGNTFIFFTDGVYECANPAGEEFGLARMEKVIQANLYKSTPEILDAITQAIGDFTKGQPLEDDLCLVAVDVTTKLRE